jgi:hypothetical protein
MKSDDDDNDLPAAFMREEPPQREAAESVLGEDDDFSTLEGAFTSIENSEEFAGLEGDIDRHTPPAEAQAVHVNEYGVKVRGAKRCQPLSDDEEIHFSVNLGDE